MDMEFFAVNGTRPVRLSEQTRQFAWESLNHRYGLETRATPGVSVDDIPGFDAMTDMERYNAAIHRVVTQAPIRICEGERVSGAATLGLAIDGQVPATWAGRSLFYAVNHLTMDSETVLKRGVDGIRADAEQALNRFRGTEKEIFIRSCLHCIDCMALWRQRYLDALKGRPEYRDNYNSLLNVPFRPASNFHEAVQSLWFTFAFTRLCGHWPGIGRIDWLLGDYLKKDLAAGTLTLVEAREILAHFFIKGCEWICGGDNYYGGDAQHYQNILLAGIDENGLEVTNEVTYLVLDIIEELGISDFPTSVRLNRNSEPKLLRRMAEVIRLGGGVLAAYNEDLVIECLVNYGYDLKEARKFGNDGCWEVQIPGKTRFNYRPFDALHILQSQTLREYDGSVYFDSFEALYDCFIRDLGTAVQCIGEEFNAAFRDTSGPTDSWVWKTQVPSTVISLFEGGCIENGLSYLEGGPVYNVYSPHIGGLPDVANSLYAIRKLVFEENKVTFPALMEILRNNWEGQEALRQYTMNKYTYFGNDNDEVDLLVARIVEDFSDQCDALVSRYKTPAGVSTFGRQLGWSPERLATPSGRKAHDVLAANFSPTPGTDREGATAIIRSYCKTDLRRTVTGGALDIKLLPSAVNGERGVEALAALLQGFVLLGGYFMQPDIADTELLKEAQAHPENYQNLSVRVSGWNARFVTLTRDWQDMVIGQTGGGL